MICLVVELAFRLAPHRYYGHIRLLIQLPSGFHLFGSYVPLERFYAAHWMRDLSCSIIYFHNIPYSLHRRVLDGCFRILALSVTFTMRDGRGSLFPLRVNMSVLQVSLYITSCCFASLSQRVATLRYNQSPDCIGCLLSGVPTLTGTGLPSVSRRRIFRTHHALLGAF